MNTKRTLIGAFIIFLGLGLSSFKDDDRNFQISKNLDIFNSIFKELDLFYVDTIDPEKMIQNGVNGMLALTDPYTEYYPEHGDTRHHPLRARRGAHHQAAYCSPPSACAYSLQNAYSTLNAFSPSAVL